MHVIYNTRNESEALCDATFQSINSTQHQFTNYNIPTSNSVRFTCFCDLQARITPTRITSTFIRVLFFKHPIWLKSLLRGTRSELAVESFFAQSYGTFKQRDIWVTIDFFQYGLYNKKRVFFYHKIETWGRITNVA